MELHLLCWMDFVHYVHLYLCDKLPPCIQHSLNILTIYYFQPFKNQGLDFPKSSSLCDSSKKLLFFCFIHSCLCSSQLDGWSWFITLGPLNILWVSSFMRLSCRICGTRCLVMLFSCHCGTMAYACQNDQGNLNYQEGCGIVGSSVAFSLFKFIIP